MEVRWKTLLTKTLIWLTAEIVLNSMGLDTLADYSEFVFDLNTISHLNSDRQSLMIKDKFEHFLVVRDDYQYQF